MTNRILYALTLSLILTGIACQRNSRRELKALPPPPPAGGPQTLPSVPSADNGPKANQNPAMPGSNQNSGQVQNQNQGQTPVGPDQTSGPMPSSTPAPTPLPSTSTTPQNDSNMAGNSNSTDGGGPIQPEPRQPITSVSGNEKVFLQCKSNLIDPSTGNKIEHSSPQEITTNISDLVVSKETGLKVSVALVTSGMGISRTQINKSLKMTFLDTNKNKSFSVYSNVGTTTFSVNYGSEQSNSGPVKFICNISNKSDQSMKSSSVNTISSNSSAVSADVNGSDALANNNVKPEQSIEKVICSGTGKSNSEPFSISGSVNWNGKDDQIIPLNQTRLKISAQVGIKGIQLKFINHLSEEFLLLGGKGFRPTIEIKDSNGEKTDEKLELSMYCDSEIDLNGQIMKMYSGEVPTTSR